MYDPLHRCLGFRYPRFGKEYFRNQDVADDIKSADGPFATQSRYLEHLEHSGCRRFLISAEKIFGLPRGPEYFEAFTRVARVRIVIFVRRQDRYLESVYRQLVKNSDTSLERAFAPFAKLRMETPERRRRIEWLTCLKPWEATFGKENITVVPYNEYERADSICVMADLVGLPLTKRLPSLGVKHGNPSLSGETTLFLRHLRAEKIRFNPLKLRQFDALIPNPSTSFLAVAKRKQIVDHFRAENEALGRHYGIDVSPLLAFDETVESKRKLLNPKEVDMAELTRLARKAGLLS